MISNSISNLSPLSPLQTLLGKKAPSRSLSLNQTHKKSQQTPRNVRLMPAKPELSSPQNISEFQIRRSSSPPHASLATAFAAYDALS